MHDYLAVLGELFNFNSGKVKSSVVWLFSELMTYAPCLTQCVWDSPFWNQMLRLADESEPLKLQVTRCVYIFLQMLDNQGPVMLAVYFSPLLDRILEFAGSSNQGTQ